MKKYIYCIFSLLILAGCSYDDSDLWNKVDDLDERLRQVEAVVNRLNSEVAAVKTLVISSGSAKAVVDVTQTATGFVFTFSDGQSVTITHGLDGQSGANGDHAPVIGIKKDSDGVYYWTVTTGISTSWLLDDEGNKMPVAGTSGSSGQNGNDGVTPVMGVDSYGFWTVDYGEGPVRILDADGNAIQAGGDAGESLFERVDTSDENFVIFYFSNGEVLVVARTDARFSFVDGTTLRFENGQARTLNMDIRNIRHAEVFSAPQGWQATVDLDESVAVITAPGAGAPVTSGMITFIAMDNRGSVMMAAVMVSPYGYDHPSGTFLVIEGNMTDDNGTLAWIDPDMNLHEKIFERANDGKVLGNVVQDIYIANGRIYILTQNGSNRGGVGRFVVCDVQTMEMEYALDVTFFPGAGGNQAWPQHIVVVSDKKAYIQWSESSWESTSGIRVMDLGNRQVAGNDIEGTYGAFTTAGALKGRMVYSRGKVFAGTGHSVSIINTETDLVEKKIELDAQVKGVVKGADGNIYVALAGQYSGGSPNAWGNFVTSPRTVGLDHTGQIIHDKTLPGVVFPVQTASPKIQMCASFNQPYLYFTDKNEFYFTSLGRYNYQTGVMDREFILTSDIYGYVGAHPVTEEIWTSSSNYDSAYTTSIKVFDPSTGAEVRSFTADKGFCAGIDFGYRFTGEFVNL